MYTVTQWIKLELLKKITDDLLIFRTEINEKNIFKIRCLHDHTQETVSPAKVGTVVDYLTRLIISREFESSFSAVYKGLIGVSVNYKFKNSLERDVYLEDTEIYERWKEAIDDEGEEIELDHVLIEEAVRLVKYDTFYRTGLISLSHPKQSSVETIENIKTLVERSVAFLTAYSPKIMSGGWISSTTTKLSAGDWDYLTEDSLIDMKVSKGFPDKYAWIQLLVYFLLGKVSEDPKFKDVDKLLVLNPRLSKIWTLRIEHIPKELIELITREWGSVTNYDLWKQNG